MSLLLGVNIDHVATLRQARYAGMLDFPNAEPCVLEAAMAAKRGGADSITIHVREDRRHMQPEDAFRLKKECGLPINLEMANIPEMVKLAVELKPEFVCLVPEKREEISTEGGLDVIGNLNSLRSTVGQLQAAGIRVSLFIDPDEAQIAAAAEIGAEMIELHTGCYANSVNDDERKIELDRLCASSEFGYGKNLQVNAGHGLNSENVTEFLSAKNLTELNIGHHLVSRALSVGLEQAVREMKQLMEGYEKGA